MSDSQECAHFFPSTSTCTSSSAQDVCWISFKRKSILPSSCLLPWWNKPPTCSSCCSIGFTRTRSCEDLSNRSAEPWLSATASISHSRRHQVVEMLHRKLPIFLKLTTEEPIAVQFSTASDESKRRGI
ncbi:hypothetical protein ILYODFUR_019103 [Ilyodon furcidens]|uniref:Uncharacterized protein n=1 Tax=Ilyodon furcidens TaxID=33524 RepID=A0ABV0VF90_9TELE